MGRTLYSKNIKITDKDSKEYKEFRARANINHRRHYQKNKKKLMAGAKAWRDADPRRNLYHGAKSRATKNEIEFKLKYTDIKIPKRCPILGIVLEKGKGKVQSSSPSLDRIDITKGYTPKNSRVISYKANRMKCDMTKSQIKKLYKYVFGLE